MHSQLPGNTICAARTAPAPSRRERGVQLVVLLTAVTMVAEIVVGEATNSMALLADGWHMATHVGALGLASAAYCVSRRFAEHRAFGFGTGKVHALAGYTSAVALGWVALSMLYESVERLISEQAVDFVSSLPVAVLGLLVNVASVLLLHGHDHSTDGHHEPGHHHDHTHTTDHNHQAAFLHVVADTLTSVLAIGALLAGQHLGWAWLDATSGLVGAVVILKWGASLLRDTAFELLDVDPSASLETDVRESLESLDDVRVLDLHVWSLGRGARSCVATLMTAAPREPTWYREALAGFGLAHVTIEVRRCSEGHVAPR